MAVPLSSRIRIRYPGYFRHNSNHEHKYHKADIVFHTPSKSLDLQSWLNIGEAFSFCKNPLDSDCGT